MLLATLLLIAAAFAQAEVDCTTLNESSHPLLVSQCAMDEDAGLAAAEEAASVSAYRAFRAAHPGSKHTAAAVEAEGNLALKDVEAIDTPEAWSQLRKFYPVHRQLSTEREAKAVAELVGDSAEMKLPCERPEPTEEIKKPKPSCGFLEAESVIRASWTTPEGYHARAQLVGWDGAKAINLKTLQAKIGAAPYASEYAIVVQASKGSTDDTGWRVELPNELRLPPGHGLIGYAVELTVMGQSAKLLPFHITEEWANTRVRTR